jgi:hypothetical protein
MQGQEEVVEEDEDEEEVNHLLEEDFASDTADPKPPLPLPDDGTTEGNLVDEDDGVAAHCHDGNDDEEDGVDNASPSSKHPPSSPKHKKKRDVHAMRKAPQAPKRFKSSYIFFFTSKQSEIKEILGDKATVMEVSKRSAQMWKDLSAEDRAYWEDVAAKDKERYMVEKASYTGPWQIPYKRVKKDPSAPKRPMSAFLLFSQGRRRKVKEENPGVRKNTEISRLLGELWRQSTDEERKPFIEKEKELREKYKAVLALWKENDDKRKEAEDKRNREQLEWQRQQQEHAQQHAEQYAQQQHAVGAQPMQHFPHLSYMQPPPPQGYAPYQQPGYPQQHYYPPASYQYPPDGKQQPVILGPNGMPHYHMYPPPSMTQSLPSQQHQHQQHSYHSYPPGLRPSDGHSYDTHNPIPIAGNVYDDFDDLTRDPQPAD